MSESSEIVWVDYVSTSIPVMIEAVLYGCYSISISVSAYILVNTRASCTISRRLLIVLMVMFVLATANLIIDIVQSVALVRADVYLLLAEFNEQSVGFERELRRWGRLNLNTSVASAFLFNANNTIGDILLIYRYYILWDSNFWVIAVPSTFTIASTALGCVAAVSYAPGSLQDILSDMQYHAIERTRLSLLPITNTLLTGLIAFRLWRQSRRIRPNIHGKRHRRIVLIIIESGAVYSASLVVLAILWSLSTGAVDYSGYPGTMVNQLVGIAPTLLVVRLHLGRRVDSYVTHGLTVSGAERSEVPFSGESEATESFLEELRSMKLPPRTRSDDTDLESNSKRRDSLSRLTDRTLLASKGEQGA